MEYSYKIYISYSNSDNTALHDQQGWVSVLEAYLLETYEQVFGEKLLCISLQAPFHDLRRVIGSGFVIDPNSTEKTGNVSGNKLPEIYFIYDKADSLHALPAAGVLQSQGFTVTLPVFEGDIQDIRKAHINNLVSCDIAVIYKKQVNDQWLRVKVSELLKAPGYGRKKQILEKAIIADITMATDRAYYENYGFKLITDTVIYASTLIKAIDAKTKQEGWIK